MGWRGLQTWCILWRVTSTFNFCARSLHALNVAKISFHRCFVVAMSFRCVLPLLNEAQTCQVSIAIFENRIVITLCILLIFLLFVHMNLQEPNVDAAYDCRLTRNLPHGSKHEHMTNLGSARSRESKAYGLCRCTV